MFFFFFSSRRRHTRYWRDWSSDVCSSDLDGPVLLRPRHPRGELPHRLRDRRMQLWAVAEKRAPGQEPLCLEALGKVQKYRWFHVSRSLRLVVSTSARGLRRLVSTLRPLSFAFSISAKPCEC